MGRHAIQAEGCRGEHTINITALYIFPIFGDLPKNKGKPLILRLVGP